ncbi:hypothetical protein FOCC_FOCC016784 [Frankliniella occidentalis]|nr:hypothetical protein FOCC_FOCC016784 [Frankliniella occidentalis]
MRALLIVSALAALVAACAAQQAEQYRGSVNAEAAAQQSSLLARAASAVPTYDRYMRYAEDRFWRKNRSTQSSRWCPGTDVNRNFGYHYKQAGTSDYPCDETYAGPKAFSEPEARNLRDYILKCQERANGNVKMYLTLHSYGPMILYPWGYDFNLPDAPDKDELISIANEANKAIIRAGSEPFVVQNSAGLYPAAGASDDWSKGVANIAKAYTIELQGGGSNGFDLPANRILGVVQQLFEGMRVFAARAKQL